MAELAQRLRGREPSHFTDNGRGRSPWLALGAFALLVGILAVAAVLVFLGSTREPDQNRLLDSFGRDARAVTPAGTREVSFSRYACGQYPPDDSAGLFVERVLKAEGAHPKGSVGDAIIAEYLHRGWAPNSYSPRDSVEKKGPDRVLWVEESADGRNVTVTVRDVTLC